MMAGAGSSAMRRVSVLPPDHRLDTLLMNGIRAGTAGVAIPDNAAGSPGLDALVRTGDWIRAGFQTFMFINCRDRNRIDLASRWSGARHIRVDGIIIEAGVHPRLGPIPEARPVHDLDPVQAVRFLRMVHSSSPDAREASPWIGMRVTVQTTDAFERVRLTRIIDAGTDMLLISCARPDPDLHRWIRHCRDIPGWDRLELWLDLDTPGEIVGIEPVGVAGVAGVFVPFT
ncbi:hypothetical protein JXA80_13875 [bacterium]|nr:hypothetical protein [candidate division CSSED10-310 bacterium]